MPSVWAQAANLIPFSCGVEAVSRVHALKDLDVLP